MILARSQQHVSRSICLVLFCEVVTALPATSFVSSLKGFLPAEGGSAVLASSFHCDPSGLQNVNPTGFVAYFFVGVGLLCIIIGLKMPKSVREKRLDREYKSSLKDLNRLRPRNGQEKVRTEENQIHRLCNESNSRKERYGEPETISNEGTGPGKEGLQVAVNRSFTFPARTRSHHPRLPRLTLAKTTRHGPGPLNSRESHNFGENPNYHDDGFQYSPAHEGRSVSTPPSPFSSRFYASNIKKVQSHKRTQSSPSAYQTFQVSMGIQNNAGSRSHFPLPTLRPVTPPEVMSTPGSPLSDSRFEEPVNNVRGYRYLRQYPQIPQSHQNTRAQSVPLPEASLTAISAPSPNTTPHFVPERQTEIVEASAHQRATEFQPVMIFEQGQSITGHKWRRKVTVFRSEILERLEKEGLVIC